MDAIRDRSVQSLRKNKEVGRMILDFEVLQITAFFVERVLRYVEAKISG